MVPLLRPSVWCANNSFILNHRKEKHIYGGQTADRCTRSTRHGARLPPESLPHGVELRGGTMRVYKLYHITYDILCNTSYDNVYIQHNHHMIILYSHVMIM